MAKKMKIKLLPNGEIQMETIGVKGKKCLDYIEVLKKLVDVKITDTQLTQEYYETETEITSNENNELRWDQRRNFIIINNKKPSQTLVLGGFLFDLMISSTLFRIIQ